MKTSLNIEFTFEQIVSLVKKLSKEQKIELSKELEKDLIDKKLSQLLSTFKTDEIDQDLLNQEIESVRKELFDKNF